MARASIIYYGDGSTTDFTVPFPFIYREHVKVYVDGSEVTPTWLNDSTVQITPAPANGAAVVIRRETPTTPIVDFSTAATLSEEHLDIATLQSVYIAEEALDTAEGALYPNSSGVYDAQGRRIANAGSPVDPADVATKAYVDATAFAGVPLPLPIDKGGTGATDAATARANLDVPSLSQPNTFKGTLTVEKLDADIVLHNSSSASGSKLQIADSDDVRAELTKINGTSSGDAILDLDPRPAGTGKAYVRLFRNASAGGGAQLVIYRGDASTTYDHAFRSGAGSSSEIAANGGKVSIGKAGPVLTLDIGGTDGVHIPTGTTAQRPGSPPAGTMRFNTDTGRVEVFDGSGWVELDVVTTATVTEAYVYKSSDTTKTNDATLADDPELVFGSILGPYEVWELSGCLFIYVHQTPDIKLGLRVPTGTTFGAGFAGVRDSNNENANGAFINDATPAGSLKLGVNRNIMVAVHGIIRTGASGGDLALQWAQDVADTNPTTVYTNSYLKLKRIA